MLGSGLACGQAWAEAGLEDVADPRVASVEALCVDAVQLSHPEREVGERRLEEQVVVVAHQAVGQAAPAEALHDLDQQFEERLSVDLVVVDRRARVPARGYVIDPAGNLQPKRPCHGASLGANTGVVTRRFSFDTECVNARPDP